MTDFRCRLMAWEGCCHRRFWVREPLMGTCGESKVFYNRKRGQGKRHNAAVICFARRRCDVILAMLRTGKCYVDSTVEKIDQPA